MINSTRRSSSLLHVMAPAFAEPNWENRTEPSPGASPEQRQALLFQQHLSPHELAYQESLIHERQAEIREIETGIHELSEIFHDLGTLVTTQGDMIGIFYLPIGLRVLR